MNGSGINGGGKSCSWNGGGDQKFTFGHVNSRRLLVIQEERDIERVPEYTSLCPGRSLD